MRKLGRRGIGITMTPFALIFFFAILLLALVFWITDTSKFDPIRPQITQDVWHQRAQTTLIGLLRTPTAIDINNDHVPDQVTLADAIVVGTMTDAQLQDIVRKRIPDGMAYVVVITYPGKGAKTVTIVGDMAKKSTATTQDFTAAAPHGSALLPSGSGNINVALYLADADLLRSIESNDYTNMNIPGGP